MKDHTIIAKICIPKNKPKIHLGTNDLLIFRIVSQFCPVSQAVFLRLIQILSSDLSFEKMLLIL
jgi:hypothetical protein